MTYLDLLEIVDLVELLAEKSNELVLILVSPYAIIFAHAVLDLLLELRVLEILVSPLGIERGLDGAAELHCDDGDNAQTVVRGSGNDRRETCRSGGQR